MTADGSRRSAAPSGPSTADDAVQDLDAEQRHEGREVEPHSADSQPRQGAPQRPEHWFGDQPKEVIDAFERTSGTHRKPAEDDSGKKDVHVQLQREADDRHEARVTRRASVVEAAL